MHPYIGVTFHLINGNPSVTLSSSFLTVNFKFSQSVQTRFTLFKNSHRPGIVIIYFIAST